jgi:endonuclease-8
MPEGDTLYRTATTLRPAMEGGVIESAELRDRQFDVECIVGRTVMAVEARGKHLLIHLAPMASSASAAALAIHSHLGMTGSWHVYRPGDAWLKPSHYASLVLSVKGLVVICFSPKLLELLTADQLRTHRHLTRLGPDLLAGEFDVAGAVARFRPHDGTPLGEAIMNQTIVCGIGNVYKSELLFLLGFDPFAPVARYSDDELAAMLDMGRRLMRRNLAGRPRQTRFQGNGQRLWVYGKSGAACPKCSTIIRLRRQGDQGRTTCWCPECQPAR